MLRTIFCGAKGVGVLLYISCLTVTARMHIFYPVVGKRKLYHITSVKEGVNYSGLASN